MSSYRRISTKGAGEASWLVPARVEQPELLDQGFGSPADVSANLREMWRTNRFLGGLPALTRHLYPRLAACKGAPITVVDLGTGSAEIPITIARWAALQGLKVRIFAVDWAARNLTVARCHTATLPDITLVRADANCLPFSPESVDFVISSLFLHHFVPGEATHLLQSAFACARRSVIMTDLTRGWLPLAGFALASPVIARNYLTRHDGALSVRRAYTPGELRELAVEAGLACCQVVTHPGWRMTLVADK